MNATSEIEHRVGIFLQNTRTGEVHIGVHLHLTQQLFVGSSVVSLNWDWKDQNENINSKTSSSLLCMNSRNIKIASVTRK
jgi:hypothetical protein